MLKRWVIWGGIAFIVFFVAFKPDSAAHVIGVLGSTTVDILKGVGDFFGSLVS